MSYLEVTFVLFMLLLALGLTLIVRRDFLNKEERWRAEQRRIERESHRQNALRGNPRSVTRR